MLLILATFTIKNKKIKILFRFFCENCWIVNHVFFVLFGMKGELSTPMMKKNPTSDVIEVLQGKSGEKKSLCDQKN